MRRKKQPLSLAIACLIFLAVMVIGGHRAKSNFNRLSDYLASVNMANHFFAGAIAEPEKEKEIVIEETTEELIKFYAEKFGVSERLLACIIWEESKNDPDAIGDDGKARGLGQFWWGTWKDFRRAMGLSTQDMRTDKAEAIKTTAWALSQDLGYHWTTYWRCLKETKNGT